MINYYSFFDELEKIAEQSPYGQQLRMGEGVEKEHAGTVGWLKKNPGAPPSAAFRSIAADHLDEDPKYYTHLKEMEDKYQEKKADAADAIAQILAQRHRNKLTSVANTLIDSTLKNTGLSTPEEPKKPMLEKASLYAAEQTGEGGDPMQTGEGQFGR